MAPARFYVIGFRAALAVAVLVILHYSTTDDPGPVVAATNDKLQHLVSFGALALLADYSFPRSRFGWAKGLGLVGFGVLIEFIQYFLPWRDAALPDVVANGVGIAAYALGAPLLHRIPGLRLLADLRRHLAEDWHPEALPSRSSP